MVGVWSIVEFILTLKGQAFSLNLCNDSRDLFHIAGSIDEEVIDCLATAVGIKGEISQAEEGIIVTEGCLREQPSGYFEEYAEVSGCLLLAPLRYERGEKRFQVVALESSQILNFYQNLVEGGKHVTIDSKRKLHTVDHDEPLIAPINLVSEFTRRQREVIETAHQDGYYSIHRETTTSEMAEKLGISRRTVEEHLRRAEKKIMDGFIDQL